MSELASGLTVSESALVVLSLVIVGLLFITVLFSGYAVLLRFRHARRDRLWQALSARWEPVVLGAIVDPESIPAAQAAVPEEYRLHFVRFVLEYTRRVRGEERVRLRRLAEPFLPLVADRVDSRRSEVRTRAVQTLGTLGLPKYGDVVERALEDPSPLVSMVAARYLARAEFPQFAPAVLRHLHRFEGWNRSFLAAMLSAIGPEVHQSLREGLADTGQPPWLRAVYAEALRMQRDPLSGDLAAVALDATGDRELVAALLRLLATVGRPEHLGIIRDHCGSADVIVRAQAMFALGELGSEAEIPLLHDALDDPSPWVALHAARGLREAGGRKLLVSFAESEHPRSSLAGQVLFEEDDS